jgi:CBS domain containing-hemolysin-like protein
MSDEYYGPVLPEIVPITETEFVIDGMARLIDLAEKLHIPLTSEDSETIAGYLSEKLQKIPDAGESITENGWTFTVTEADQTHVYWINVRKDNIS